MMKRKTFAPAIKAPAPQDDDPIPDNIDDFRNAMARRIYKFIGNHTGAWRGCPEKCCRRARHCIAPRGDCINLPPQRETTPEEDGRAIAEFYRMLRERLERDEARDREAAK